MIGQILINFLFASAIVSSGAYFLSLRGNDLRLRTLGRSFLLVVFGGMLIASAVLLYNIVTHDFRYTYVQSYSSENLPWYLLVATFYSGQEGSFMLWTLLTSLIGVSLLPYVRRHQYESEVMGFFSLIIMFLLLMLVAKSPFAYVWETYAANGIAEGFMPQAGRGLNPLLQNGWITIHPPILFTGFASMSVPFAFAMAALIKRDFHHWVKVALPWTLFAAGILGFGIMLGGFWAYETLGWGGFWAWDPVENSSLIPWLVCVALVHTMLTQLKTKGLVRTNIVLALAAFVFVLYSTFLTRSGVLGDSSVHSFVDPGMFAYILLLVFIGTFVLIGLGLIVMRGRKAEFGNLNFKFTSREFTLSIGAAIIMISAMFVFFGTSWPVFHDLLGLDKVAATTPDFYNKTHLYIAMAIGVINAISLIQSWRATPGKQFVRRMLLPFGLSIAATVASYVLGIRDLRFTALAFSSFLALFVNLELFGRMVVKTPLQAGTFVAHFGVALLFLGIITTARYTQTEHLRLVQGEPVRALGHTFTFVGKEQVEKHFLDREKWQYHVRVDDKEILKPVLYWSDYNQRQSAFLEPGISWGFVRDVYVTPKATETVGDPPMLTMKKTQTMAVPLDTSYNITMVGFDMSAMMQNTDANKLRMGVQVDIEHNGQTSSHVVYTTFMGEQMASRLPSPVQIPNTSYWISFDKLIPNRESLGQSQVVLAFVDMNNPATQPKDVFVIEASVKPLIGLVWIGVILMVAGFFVSIARRVGDLKRELSRKATASGEAKTPVPNSPVRVEAE